MHGLIVDRMTVDARLPRHNNALIDQLQAALTHWAEHSLHGISDSLSARIIPALTVNLGKIPEKNLLNELCTRLDRALTEALARLVPEPDAEQRREQLARWLQHGTPLWTQPTLCRTALGALLYAELRRPDGIAWLTPLLARQAARARLLHLPAPLLEAILAQMEDHPASAEQSSAERLSKVLQSWDDALPRTGQERGHWQQLLRQIERGLEQEKYDGWLEDLMLALARHGAPPGLSHKLQALIRGSRLPCEPDSLRARHVCSAWRSSD
ncbi:MAG: hypothetical protein K2Q15_15835, partial [Burkholderiales bacterium]|nr:hypothetical protein [Burkholderiales bacterium]